MPSSVSRRTFVATGMLGAVTPLFIPSSVLGRLGRVGANDRIGVGFIGMGKRAFELLGPFMNRSDCRVTAVCDVDTTRREQAKKRVDAKYDSSDCGAYVDYQELLARPDVDAVVICTPDHWHVNQVLHASERKKDIYCEKPLTLTLRECKLMIDAVRRNNGVFQTGSQQRTEYGHEFVKACEYVRAGRIGRLATVHVGVGVSSKWCDLKEEAIEPGLDWDRWLGPSPVRGYSSVLSPRGVINHYPDWRLYREYSGGMMTDFGAHNFDIAQWGMGTDETGPVEVVLPKDEQATYGAKLVYANGVDVFHGGPTGVTFTGTSGQIHVWRDRLSSIDEKILKEPLTDKDARLPRHKDHISNFIDCIRTRERCVCDVEVGARSVACAHLCNAAYWGKRNLKWDPQTWEFVGDDAANKELLDRERRKGYEV